MTHSAGHSPPHGAPRPTFLDPSVSTLSVKLPPFWPSDPAVWFAQVDAHFATKRITSQKTKFDYVIASLEPEYAAEVRDLILDPPSTTPYDTLKTQLIQWTSASEQRRLQQLFNSEELGDRTPSQLLRRMQQLLGDKAATADKSFLQELFLQRLPRNVRMVLASTTTESLKALATLADRIMEVSSPSVASVDSSSLSVEVGQLRNEVATLKQLVQTLNTSSPNRQPVRCHSPSPAPRHYCWYHSRFADKATKCQKPCSWDTDNGQAGC